MKKALVVIAGLVILAACGGGSTETKQEEGTAATTTETAAEPAMSPEAEKGLELVAKSDCLTCHKVAEASVGPAYEAIAAKYPDNDAVVDSLSQKIIKGGAGNWGTVPMTPHADLSPDDAKAMVKYVLSLK